MLIRPVLRAFLDGQLKVRLDPGPSLLPALSINPLCFLPCPSTLSAPCPYLDNAQDDALLSEPDGSDTYRCRPLSIMSTRTKVSRPYTLRLRMPNGLSIKEAYNHAIPRLDSYLVHVNSNRWGIVAPSRSFVEPTIRARMSSQKTAVTPLLTYMVDAETAKQVTGCHRIRLACLPCLLSCKAQLHFSCTALVLVECAAATSSPRLSLCASCHPHGRAPGTFTWQHVF